MQRQYNKRRCVRQLGSILLEFGLVLPVFLLSCLGVMSQLWLFMMQTSARLAAVLGMQVLSVYPEPVVFSALPVGQTVSCTLSESGYPNCSGGVRVVQPALFQAAFRKAHAVVPWLMPQYMLISFRSESVNKGYSRAAFVMVDVQLPSWDWTVNQWLWAHGHAGNVVPVVKSYTQGTVSSLQS